jgi:hypothetical protein
MTIEVMSKRLLILLFGLVLTTTLWAQNSMSDVNSIKRDANYLYGEATLDNRESALKLAYELLESEIKNWAVQKNPKTGSVLVSKIYEYADTIVLPRRNLFRAFVFVKKSNLKTIKGKTMIVEVCQPKPEPQPEAKPKGDSQSEIKPESKEEPKEEPKPEVKTDIKEEPKVEPKPVVEEKSVREEVLECLMTITKFQDLQGVMTPLKDEGKITEFGKYTSMPDPAGSYLIVYDQQGVIKAFLDKGTTTRRNLKTGAEDSEKNYHGCGALWFKVKE